jgi:hypothetical protein
VEFSVTDLFVVGLGFDLVGAWLLARWPEFTNVSHRPWSAMAYFDSASVGFGLCR